MKRCVSISATVSVIVIFVSFTAIAAPMGMGTTGTGTYIVGKFGVFSPTADEIENYDDEFSFEGALGQYFSPFLAAELGVGRYRTDGDVTVVTNGRVFGRERIRVTPVTVSLRLCWPVARIAEVYGIAGLGAYFVNDDISISGYKYIEDDTTELGIHAGAGIHFYLTSNVFVGAEVKYVWLEAKLYGQDVDLNGVRTTANIGFRF